MICKQTFISMNNDSKMTEELWKLKVTRRSNSAN